MAPGRREWSDSNTMNLFPKLRKRRQAHPATCRFKDSLLSLLRMRWDHEPAASGGTARQRLGLRENRTTDWDVRLRAAPSAAFAGTRRMGKRQVAGAVQTCRSFDRFMERDPVNKWIPLGGHPAVCP